MKGKTVFRIEIELGNETMRTDEDIRRALKQVAALLPAFAGEERRVLDYNGNAVGKWGFYTE